MRSARLVIHDGICAAYQCNHFAACNCTISLFCHDKKGPVFLQVLKV